MANGHTTTVVYADGTQVVTAWDAAGKKLSVTNYDWANRLVKNPPRGPGSDIVVSTTNTPLTGPLPKPDAPRPPTNDSHVVKLETSDGYYIEEAFENGKLTSKRAYAPDGSGVPINNFVLPDNTYISDGKVYALGNDTAIGTVKITPTTGPVPSLAAAKPPVVNGSYDAKTTMRGGENLVTTFKDDRVVKQTATAANGNEVNVKDVVPGDAYPSGNDVYVPGNPIPIGTATQTATPAISADNGALGSENVAPTPDKGFSMSSWMPYIAIAAIVIVALIMIFRHTNKKHQEAIQAERAMGEFNRGKQLLIQRGVLADKATPPAGAVSQSGAFPWENTSGNPVVILSPNGTATPVDDKTFVNNIHLATSPDLPDSAHPPLLVKGDDGKFHPNPVAATAMANQQLWLKEAGKKNPVAAARVVNAAASAGHNVNWQE